MSDDPAPHPSETDSVRHETATLHLVNEQMALIFRQVQEQTRLVQDLYKAASPLLEETRDTMDLLQQVIAEKDQQLEKLGKATVALVQLRDEIAGQVAQLAAFTRQSTAQTGQS